MASVSAQCLYRDDDTFLDGQRDSSLLLGRLPRVYQERSLPPLFNYSNVLPAAVIETRDGITSRQLEADR
jgi:hypothetical protein